MQLYPSGTRIANRYEIAGRPLIGGMGVVHLCFDHQEQRPVALKTFKPEFLPDRAARDRFLREGSFWMRLGKHPHIVRCYDAFLDSPRPEVYLVLELVAKEERRRDASLRAWLTSGRGLPTDQALLITLQIVRGMRHATQTIPGFVHRDLKPENVLIGADRLSGTPVNRVRVTDFGLARSLQLGQAATQQATTVQSWRPRQLTRAGALLGTPSYMAPEQWERANVDVRADIYALGCILVEMLTGRMAVQYCTLVEMRRAHQEGQVLTHARIAPGAVQELLTGCLAVIPENRFRDWETIEGALATTYSQVTGKTTPNVEAPATLIRSERVVTGWSFCDIGVAYLEIGKPETSLGFFEQALQIGCAENERRLEAIGLANLGDARLQLGDAKQSIEYLERAIAVSRQIGYRQGEGKQLGDLGTAFRLLGQTRLAVKYLEQSLAIHREIGDRRGEGDTLGNLGSTYGQLGDFERAIDLFQQSLVIHLELGDRHGESDNRRGLGVAYASRGDTQQAICFCTEALRIVKKIGDDEGVASISSVLATIYARTGDAQALTLAQQAARLWSQLGNAAYAQRAQQLVVQLEKQGG
jgi:tetratricopeptide (TPR) repeat protein